MKLLPKHPLKQFLLLFVVSYAFLMLLATFTGIKSGYDNGYRSLGNTYFQPFKEKGYVIFSEGADPLNKGLNTQLALINIDQNNQAIASGTNVRTIKVYVSPFRSGLFPLILLLSLILASPVPWRRKVWLLPVGFIIISLFAYFRTWLTVLLNFDQNEWLEVVDLSPTMHSFYNWLEAVTVGNVVFSVVVPVVVWFIITFRKEDRSVLFRISR